MSASTKADLNGVNGKRMAVDLSKIEMIEDAGDWEVWMHSSSDWYRVRGDYAEIVKRWQDG